MYVGGGAIALYAYIEEHTSLIKRNLSKRKICQLREGFKKIKKKIVEFSTKRLTPPLSGKKNEKNKKWYTCHETNSV